MLAVPCSPVVVVNSGILMPVEDLLNKSTSSTSVGSSSGEGGQRRKSSTTTSSGSSQRKKSSDALLTTVSQIEQNYGGDISENNKGNIILVFVFVYIVQRYQILFFRFFLSIKFTVINILLEVYSVCFKCCKLKLDLKDSVKNHTCFKLKGHWKITFK